ncbi:peptidase family M48-domain-containing protein [Phascolomyces articulosus]|uniref:Peptidase family M48-domain-containing protein n=1 Tax=Phascolomyces articulosus TaxID=60185 RepID=A0AAD5JPD1_9FUNG|nr:peptidase family M48-domain-containing protein [Phascolomyces articulosus]
MLFSRVLRSTTPLTRSQWRRHLCSNCYRHQRFLPPRAPLVVRSFHTTNPRPSPLLPLPAVLLSVLKSGKLVSLVSLSSKTSLTLLPHTYGRDRGKLVFKLLASIPLIGVTLLLLVGLDQAPNTSRLRLIYLTEPEAEEYINLAVDQLLGNQIGLIAPQEDIARLWIEEVVNNIATVAVDDVRDPVRLYDRLDEAKKEFNVILVRDASTENAMCIGPYVIMYDAMLQRIGPNTDRLAVILSHEIAHSLQRHFVEQNGLESLLLMLTDIARAVFWMFTEPLGPYVNQKIDQAVALLIESGSGRSYNRILEQEADLIGLKLLAKAGYNPEAAIEVWETMAQARKEEEEAGVHVEESQKRENLEIAVAEYLDSVISNWFGSTHPPNDERIQYMRENMDEALQIHQETLKINGPPICSFTFEDHDDDKTLNNDHASEDGNTTVVELEMSEKKGWYRSVWDWIWRPSTDTSGVPQDA